MNKTSLKAFHGNLKTQQLYIREIQEWIDRKPSPRSAHEIAVEINNPYCEFEEPECILEEYDSFVEKLGLPQWLALLLYTINHHNSHTLAREKHYEDHFYKEFISACQLGVDYSMMYHQWELFLLKDLIPQKEKNNKLIKKAITLHERVLSGHSVNFQEWRSFYDELSEAFNEIDRLAGVPDELLKKEKTAGARVLAEKNGQSDEFRIAINELFLLEKTREAYGKTTWHSLRVSFLAVMAIVDDSENVSSAEALVESKWQEAIILGSNLSVSEREFSRKTWFDLMSKLLEMLKEWKG